MRIDTVEALARYYTLDPDAGVVYVNESVMRDWRLNNRSLEIDGEKCNIYFKSKGGEVYSAELNRRLSKEGT